MYWEAGLSAEATAKVEGWVLGGWVSGSLGFWVLFSGSWGVEMAIRVNCGKFLHLRDDIVRDCSEKCVKINI